MGSRPPEPGHWGPAGRLASRRSGPVPSPGVLPLRAGLVQMRAVPSQPDSVALAKRLARQAVDRGAQLIVLPENHAGIGAADRRGAWAFSPDRPLESPAVAPFADLARDGRTVILGGIPERIERADPPGHAPHQMHNTLLVLHDGKVAARYRKIHLFDAHLADGSELAESVYTRPGQTPTVLVTDEACIGLSICYDLRFPELYRAMTAAGAEVIVVPSAFTLLTGMAHWDVLLRARAIENQCWVVAPAQWGRHGPERHSYGHSLVVDPWGTVVAGAGDADAVVVADLDPDTLARVRRDLPALDHRRLRDETLVHRVSLVKGYP